MEKFIICSNVPGCKEIVKNNFNGYLIKPNDTEDLIKKIKNFMKLPKLIATSVVRGSENGQSHGGGNGVPITKNLETILNKYCIH
jgi:glycosyltransferase involved in cell wall biosynthesis